MNVEIYTRTAVEELRDLGFTVTEPEDPKNCDAYFEVDVEVPMACWDEAEPSTIDARACADLIAACIIGDLQLARSLVTRAFENEADQDAIEQAILSARRMAA
jgi:hypothetical protein